MGWSVGDGRPGVPDHQLLVVSHGPEQGLVEQMPGDVLHHRGVTWTEEKIESKYQSVSHHQLTCENSLGVDDLVLLGSGVDVPQTDGVVIGGGQQVAVQVGVPGEAVAFLLVSSQLQVWVTFPAGVGLAGVLGVVEHQHVGAGGLGGDDAGVLRHVPGPVDLTLVVDLDLDLNLARHGAKPSKLSLLVV